MQTKNIRTERDALGSRDIAAHHYFGVQTQRALENFGATGQPLANYTPLITALATIKRACAQANASLGVLPAAIAAAVLQACDELIAGQWHDHFPISLLQGGAGTSTNMNTNEVIANRALEILGADKGRYDLVHPNDHINAGQSTNDVYPSALRLALFNRCDALLRALDQLAQSFHAQATAATGIQKVARTQLQDAVPMAASDELQAFATSIAGCRARLAAAREPLLTINLGGTAIGSCINSSPEFRNLSFEHLRRATGLPLARAADLFQASWDTGELVDFSGALKRCAITLSKIASDLRLLSAGPKTGLGDLSLPKQQPGSSIMPGKVNPVIPELINQIAFDVSGRDHTLCLAAEQGQLQLNAFEPVMAECLFTSLDRLQEGCELFRTKCVEGLAVNASTCSEHLHQSHALATRFNRLLGYTKTSELINASEQQGLSFIEFVRAQGLVPDSQLNAIIDKGNDANV